MLKDIILPRELIKGRVRLTQVPTSTPWQRWGDYPGNYCANAITYDWATTVINQLAGAPDGRAYKIGGMYLLYENAGGAAVTPPVFTRSDGLSFLDGLAVSSPDSDYLRVPLIATALSSSDEELFPDGNKISFYAHTAGSIGALGKPFSDAADSRIYAAFLAVFRQANDASQDLIWANLAFPEDEQLIKVLGSQIAVTWEQNFG